ncbi:MAG: CRISPR-associated protein [Acidobacteria bacterium]|nr:CRISPR-associated protein [Acidobacteriota bacterium]
MPFLIGAIAMAVIGNEITQVLNNWLGSTTKAALSIAVGAFLVLAFCVWLLMKWLSRLTPPPDEFKQKRPDRRRGLILLVSKPETSRKALDFHIPTLERCWLLCSIQSLQVAESLRAEFQSKVQAEFQTKLHIPDPTVINDVNNPLEFTDRVNEIYSNLPSGWGENDVIADYTGMTAHGSVGMALACLSPSRPLQYTPGKYDSALDAIAPLDPIEIVLRSEIEGKDYSS